jgi:ATP-dependent Clp protease ATP-binding subunit ClpC
MIYINLCGQCFRELKEQSGETSSLDHYSRDLTKLALEGKLDPVVGRKDEIQRVIHILSRRTKNNPVLIGDPGVGKTAIVEGLAQRISYSLVPETLLGKRLMQLDLSLMLAGTSHRGQFEQRLKNTISEVKKASGQIILFIDELHTVVGAGAAQGAIDAANILKPSLARGELQAIGATTLDEYRQYIERDGALERRFQPIVVSEPSVSETVAILKGLRQRYEQHHHVEITDEALEAAAKLSDRYISERFLPDKAVDLMDEASSKVRLSAVEEPENLRQVNQELKELEGRSDLESKQRIAELENVRRELMDLWVRTKMEEVPQVTGEHVARVVSRMTGVPLTELTESERNKLIELEDRIHERLVNQNEAVGIIAEAIRRSRSGLKDPKRPIGSFIFLGPSGVGKTELARTLSEVLYGSEEHLVRLDMSEYMEKHAVSRMIGSPPGYIGFEQGGQLTEVVRRRPFSIILLDEIEKAHPEVFNLLLQIMEDGRLTDGHGRTVDFKNAILIMTSNIGSELIFEKSNLGFAVGKSDSAIKYEDLKDEVVAKLRRAFRPEFLNRIDEVVIFKSLTASDIQKIARLELNKVSALMEEQEIGLSVSESVVKHLAAKGYLPEYGARPLKRLIQNKIENPISAKIISGEISCGDKVRVSLRNNRLVFSPSRVKVKVKV